MQAARLATGFAKVGHQPRQKMQRLLRFVYHPHTPTHEHGTNPTEETELFDASEEEPDHPPPRPPPITIIDDDTEVNLAESEGSGGGDP